MIKYAQMCAVEILWYELSVNHLHTTLRQGFDQHDRRRRLGISPFIRNVLAVWVKRANSFYSLQGRLSERTFRSYNLASNERLLANQAYTLANVTHHTGKHPSQATHSAWGVYTAGKPDGVVNAMPMYLEDLVDIDTADLIVDIADRAILIEAAGEKGAWLKATREVLAERAPVFPSVEFPGVGAVEVFLDGQRHQKMVQQRLAWRFPRIEFQPRSMPNLGQIIQIAVRNELDTARAFT